MLQFEKEMAPIGLGISLKGSQLVALFEAEVETCWRKFRSRL